MSFTDTLERHLTAIRGRDLGALIDTISPDRLLLVTANGELFTSSEKFIELHREWFASTTWELDARIAETIETPEMCIAVIELDYRDVDEGGGEVRERSYLTLVFENRDGRWLLVQDQNTPIKDGDRR